MIDKQLLELLVCPENHTALHEAEPSLVERINQAIQARRLKNRAGRVVEQAIQGGLVRQDGTLLYPVIDDIPVLLIEEAIPLEQLS
jgi:uncharacterized protein YbaR (Trm112 family)